MHRAPKAEMWPEGRKNHKGYISKTTFKSLNDEDQVKYPRYLMSTVKMLGMASQSIQ